MAPKKPYNPMTGMSNDEAPSTADKVAGDLGLTKFFTVTLLASTLVAGLRYRYGGIVIYAGLKTAILLLGCALALFQLVAMIKPDIFVMPVYG